MVAVVVNGPLGKDHVRLLGFDQLRVRLVVCIVHHGVAVDLSGVGGARLEYSQALFASAILVAAPVGGHAPSFR